jgi:hypothetical protein
MKQNFKSICLLMTLFVITGENIGYGQTPENPYTSADCGLAVTSTETSIDAILGNEVTWSGITATYSQTPTATTERFPGTPQFSIRKIQVGHKWLGSSSYTINTTPTPQSPESVAHTIHSITNGAYFDQIKFTPSKAGYTKETYRVYLLFPMMKKQTVNGVEQNIQLQTTNNEPMYWYDYKDISITYAVPEFRVVAVKFTSDHGMLRPNVNTTAPDSYKIGNAQTYKAMYPDGTLQWNYTRNANGELVKTVTVDEPITHTWKHADPTAKIEYSVRLKNFGATIKGKIYFGDAKPNNTNPLYDPPAGGNYVDYSGEDPNNNGAIGYSTLTRQFDIRHETSNTVICPVAFDQKVYWTFGAPQVEINEARMNVAVGNVFNGQTKTETKLILQEMLK